MYGHVLYIAVKQTFSTLHTGTAQTSSAETKKLVSVYLHGTGLPPPMAMRRPLPQQSPGKMAMARGVGGRMPSAVRTDLKQGIQTAVAPYGRPK